MSTYTYNDFKNRKTATELNIVVTGGIDCDGHYSAIGIHNDFPYYVGDTHPAIYIFRGDDTNWYMEENPTFTPGNNTNVELLGNWETLTYGNFSIAVAGTTSSITKIFSLPNSSEAGRFYDGTNTVRLADGVYAINATGNIKATGVLTATNTFVRDFNFLLGTNAPVTTGNDKCNALITAYAGTIIKCKAYAKTAPTGQALIMDIKLDGTSIWNITTGNRISIADGSNLGVQTSFDTSVFLENESLTIDVIQVGSSTAGQDVTVQLTVKYSA